MITVCKVFTKIDFQENEVMALFHGKLQLIYLNFARMQTDLSVYMLFSESQLKIS